jgi:WD40 repeat protein
MAYVACSAAGIRAYEIASGRLMHSADESGMAATAITLADNAVFGGDIIGGLHRFDRQLGGRQLLADRTCGNTIRRVATDRAGATVVFAGDSLRHHTCMYQAHLRHGSWQRNLHQLPLGPGEKAHAITIAPDASVAAIGLSDGDVYLWRPDTLDPLGSHRDFGGEVRGTALAPDGRWLLVASEDGLLELLPTCTVCGSARELADRAGEILARARTLGLYDG